MPAGEGQAAGVFPEKREDSASGFAAIVFRPPIA
jgi:hypothetical protein